MGGKLAMIISGTTALIMLYLFLSNYKGSVAIIKQIGSTYTSGVRTLQGR